VRERWTDTLTPLERRLLAARTEALAAEKQGRSETGARVPYIRVRLGAVEHYGIPYQYTAELLYTRGLAPVPCTPALIAGIVNRRGEMLTVLDLARLFRVDSSDRGEEARIVVVSNAELVAGLLVDAVLASETYDPSQLTPSLATEDTANRRYVKGIHDGGTTILDLNVLLADPAIRIEERVV